MIFSPCKSIDVLLVLVLGMAQQTYATNLIAQEAVRVIKNHDPGKPLFLYVPFNAPHSPIQAPEK